VKVAPISLRAEEVRRMLVLRPNAIGDYVFSPPALHALRQRYPYAHIVFLGRAWHWEFLRDRPGPIGIVRCAARRTDAGNARTKCRSSMTSASTKSKR
jgi:hypothetical protein